MARSNTIWDKNSKPIKDEEEKDPIDVELKLDYNEEPDTVSIRSLIDATVKLTGSVTGQAYVWNGSGDITSVDSRDKDEILNKKRGRACCGGTSGRSLFELV